MSAPELAAVATVLATVVVLVLSTLTESIGAPSVLDATTAIFLPTPWPISTAPVETLTDPSL